MKKNIKNIICILISLFLLCTSFILPTVAEESEASSSDEVSQNESSSVSENSEEYGYINILTCDEGYTSLSIGTHQYKFEITEVITFFPNSGYQIYGVEVNGVFQMLEGNTISVNVEFGKTIVINPVFRGNIIFNVEQKEGGKVTPEGTSYIGSGDYFDIIATPDDGYICSGIYINDDAVETVKDGNIYRASFKAPRESSYTVYALFTPIVSHKITLDKTGNGKVLPFDNEGLAYINSGSDGFFQAIPDEGYGISEIKIDGKPVEWSADGVFSVKNVTSDIKVEITFVEMVSIPIQITSSGKGKISSASRAYVGTTLVLDVAPDEGYEIVSLTINEKPTVLNDAGKLVLAITDEIIAMETLKIDVVFDKIVDKFVIRTNVKNGIGGTISAEGYVFENMQTDVRKGGNITISFTPDMGYILSEVKINSIVVALSADNTYTISNISQSYNVSATFSLDPTASGDFVKIDVTVGNGGSVVSDPPVSSSLEYVTSLGGNIAFTIIPDDGYVIDYIVVNGEKNTIMGNQYVFENVITDSKLEIYFKKPSSVETTEGNITWGTFETIVDISSTTIVTKEQFEKIKEKAHSKPLVIQTHGYSWTIPAHSTYPSLDTDFNIKFNEDINNEVKTKIKAKLEEKLSSHKIQSLENIIIETNGISLPTDTYLTIYAGSNFIGKELDYLSYDTQNDKFLSIAEELNKGKDEPVYSYTIKVDNSGKTSFAYNGDKYIILTVSTSSQYRFNVDIIGSGSVSPRGISYVYVNDNVHLQITPNPGYMVESITVNGTLSYEDYKGRTSGFTISFGKISKNTDVIVTFAPSGATISEEEIITSDSGGIKPATVALIIIGIAIVGGIVLFIYKWNEEKDIVD